MLCEFVVYKFKVCIFISVSNKKIKAHNCSHLPSEQQVTANCADTIAFVEERAPNDPLIKGVPDDKNPYKGDKGGCIIT